MFTYIIAEVVGVVFTVLGLSMLVNKKSSDSLMDGLMRDKSLLWSVGFMITIMGAVIVVLNNVWLGGLTLFVTIIGWLTLIKGATILICPNWTVKMYKKLGKDNLVMFGGVGALIIGVILLYVTLV